MLKLSSRGHYGLQAMAELARAYGQGPISLARISEAREISLPYLEQIAAQLKKAGLITSIRGVRGGYLLSRDPSETTVGDIVRALEGPIAPVDCVSEQENPGCCEREQECATKVVWVRMRDSIAETLDSTTLADLVSNV